MKPVFGVIGAVVPVVYCGYLLYYFLDVSGSVQEAERDGLGPTLMGLGIVGLLFCIVLIVKLFWIFGGPRSPGSGGRSTHEGEDEFDADAAVARYLARQAAEAAAGSPVAPHATEGATPARRPSFGRKTR